MPSTALLYTGIVIPVITRTMPSTIINSINENPFCRRIYRPFHFPHCVGISMKAVPIPLMITKAAPLFPGVAAPLFAGADPPGVTTPLKTLCLPVRSRPDFTGSLLLPQHYFESMDTLPVCNLPATSGLFPACGTQLH